MAVCVAVKLWVLVAILAVMSKQTQGQFVFNVTGTNQQGPFVFYFSKDKFMEFYHCLCNRDTVVCSATADLYGIVESTSTVSLTPAQLANFKISNRYYCEKTLNTLSMSCYMFQLDQPDCSTTTNCSTYHVLDNSISCDVNLVSLIWNPLQVFKPVYDQGTLDIKQCQAGCINPDAIPLSPLAMFTVSPSSPAIASSLPTSNQSFAGASHMLNNQSSGEDKTTIIIVGVVVSVIAVAGILVVVGVVVWRRKRNTALNKTFGPAHNDTRISITGYGPHNTSPTNSINSAASSDQNGKSS